MEISNSLSCKLLHNNLYCSAPILPSRVPSIPLSLIPSSKRFSKLVEFRSAVRKQRGIIGPSSASGIRASSADDGERWLLEPVGDGDSRHIGFKVQMPDAFEIASNAVTVGRVPQKADMVIPVATGDIHLAMFLVLKLDDVKPPTDAEESPEQPEAGSSSKTIDAVTAN